MLDPVASFALAERVAFEARQLGFETALIGAAALAVHRYTRGTEDIDLGVVVDPWSQLTALEQAMAAAGLHTVLRMPDNEDPLGGVLVVWRTEDAFGDPEDVVEVVNFRNPLRPVATPAATAIARAEPLAETHLRCVTLVDLVALKLYAGGLSDLADIVQLLAHNPEVDLTELRATAAGFDADDQLETLIARAATLHSRR